MDDIKFQLRYLPLFYEDMAEVVDYISNDLQNPDAALKLIDLTEQAILNRLDHPPSFQPIRLTRDRKHPYYRINVNQLRCVLCCHWRRNGGQTIPIQQKRYTIHHLRIIGRFARAAICFAYMMYYINSDWICLQKSGGSL